MPPSRPPQPTRFAIQKARGKGWKTLEVGEDLDQAKARFELMIGVNPKAYFRLIQLDYNPESGYEGMEFNWTLIDLYDPTQKGTRGGAATRPPSRQASRPGSAVVETRGRIKERVRIPVRFYLAVVLIGILVGGLAYLRYGLPGR